MSDLASQLADLADAVDALADVGGLSIEDARPLEGDDLRAQLTVAIDEEGVSVPTDSGSDVTGSMYGEEVVPVDGDEQDDDEQDDDEHTCPDCGATFDSAKGMRIHRANASACGEDGSELADGDGEVPCPDCGETFGSKRAMRIHRTNNDGCGDDDQEGSDDHAVGDRIDEDLEDTSDREASADGGVATVDGTALPAGVTPEDIDAAIDAADNPVYVDDVADDLGLDTAAARAALHAVGRYGDVREGRRYGGAE